MAEENVRVVEAAFDAFAKDGVDAALSYWTDDLDHRAVEGAIDDRGPIHGKNAMRAYAEDWSESFDDFKIEAVELIDAGDDLVVAILRASGRAKQSGVETEVTYASLYTIRDGKIARGREYWTREEALEAAALRD